MFSSSPSRVLACVVAVGLLVTAAGLSTAGDWFGPASSVPYGSEPYWTVEGGSHYARFGWCLAGTCDVNNDGYGDMIVGSLRYTGGQEYEGRALAFHGGPLGLETTPSWTAEGNQYAAFFGILVAALGDVDNDGYSDIAVTARDYENGEEAEGGVFLYRGGPSGLESSASWTAEGDQIDAWFGVGLAGAGDVNGDGYSDLIAGAAHYDSTCTDEGAAFVYHGGPGGLSASPDWVKYGREDSLLFGYSVASAGDVNGDGYDDVVIGAVTMHGVPPRGRAYVYHGGPSGLAAEPAWTAELDQDDTSFGGRVAGAGDVNGDGYDDVIIGATGYDDGQVNEGAAFVYHGGPSGLSTTPAWMEEGNQDDAAFGARVVGAGDVNEDGYADVLVAATLFDAKYDDQGRVYLYLGGPFGLEDTAAWSHDGGQAGAMLGVGLAGVGDVSNDGDPDIALGEPDFTNHDYREGRVLVFYSGNPTPPGPEPYITSIIDYPQDQGKQVILSWRASSFDVPPNESITHYSVWRRYLGGGALSTTVPSPAEFDVTQEVGYLADELAASGWEYVADQEARYLEEYAMTVPTYADSTGSGIPYTGYIVMAHTSDRWTFYTSAPDSGYSVDNLPPECPAQLAGEYLEGAGVLLSWQGGREPDVSHYAVYRSDLPDFAISNESLIGTAPDTSYVDGECGEAPHYYKVSAYDKNGNEGPPALLTPGDILNAPWIERGYADLLYQNVPNPFGGSTRISFSIRHEGHVRLIVYDAMGRAVRVLIDGELGPDHYAKSWDGRDNDGRPVPSGTYFYLIEAPGWRGGRKMSLVR